MSIEEADGVPQRFIPLVCVLALVAAFAVDLFTPELFVVAILLDVPIVLSSMGGSARFRLGLILAALLADALAGYVNGVHAGMHWDAVGIGDRILAALSIVFVGYLSTALRDNAQRAGLAASRERRARREAQIAAAIERVRASLSTELVARAIATESLGVLDAAEARFVLSGPAATTLVARRGAEHVEVDETRLPPASISLVQRAADEGDVIAVDASDALGRLTLETLASESLVAIPIADGEWRFGVLLVLGAGDDRSDESRETARTYAQQAANAMTQARLFEQLAERNTALEERSGIIRDLVYALSHDLRTPLAALGMTLRQAHGGAYGDLPERYRAILEQSYVATDDVQRLAETLLLVARFESGDRRPQRNDIPLAELTRQISGELDALASERGVDLGVIVSENVVAAGDRSDVRRAITNLVANALEHTAAGGHVTLTIKREGPHAIVEVCDDGFGVSERMRTHLFTRFARGDDRGGAGSGLGLYIVRRVAEESGGNVDYRPNDPQGSIFTLRLPAVTPA